MDGSAKTISLSPAAFAPTTYAFILFEGVFTTLPTSAMPWKPVTEVAVNLVANTNMLAGYLFHKHLLSCKIALNGA